MHIWINECAENFFPYRRLEKHDNLTLVLDDAKQTHQLIGASMSSKVWMFISRWIVAPSNINVETQFDFDGGATTISQIAEYPQV